MEGMKKGLIVAGVVILLLVGGGGVFWARSKRIGRETDIILPSPTQQEDKATNNTTSLKDLILSARPLTCTFNSAADSGSVSGTVYISEGKIRGDFVATGNGKEFSSHMIADGKFSYVWMDGETSGLKMAFDPKAQPTGQPNNSPISVDEQADYKCVATKLEAGKFEVPGTVEFVTINP